MTALTALWLPILLSAVIVFIASSIIHMAPLWHRNDYPRLDNQDAVGDALRNLKVPPGTWFMPRSKDMAEMKTAEFKEKMKRGPVVMMTVFPGEISMGRNMALWFVHLLVIGVFCAYITSRAVPPHTPYIEVFRFAGATAFIAHCVALWQIAIWYGRSWAMTIKESVDGLIYALLTAGVFGWLWPR
jgi:hypothetical protein